MKEGRISLCRNKTSEQRIGLEDKLHHLSALGLWANDFISNPSFTHGPEGNKNLIPTTSREKLKA